MCMSESDELDLDIDSDALPPEWYVKQPYSSSVRLHAPDSLDHVLIQDWSEAGDETNILIEPMVASNSPGASSENVPEHSMAFSDEENAIKYAYKIAHRIHNNELRLP